MSVKSQLTLSVLACSWVWAADYAPLDVKTGVWETTTTTVTTGAPPIPDSVLSKLTPDQRAKMEAALKGRNGQPQTSVHRSCVKKEDLAKALFGDPEKRCIEKLVSSSGSNREIEVDCQPNGQAKFSGKLRLDASNSENVKIAGQLTTTAGGNSMTVNMTSTAKWISATCTGNEK